MRTVLANMQGRMPEAHVLEIMKPLIRSLASMHKAGIIHRDIAPDNIMIQPDGSVKLLDFGAAKEMTTDGKSTGVIIKQGYAPEEQYDPNLTRQGPWTDVYAICATIFRAIDGDTPPDAIARLRRDEFEGFHVPVSENTRRAVTRGLAVAPENRWRDIDELARALYATAATQPTKKRKPETFYDGANLQEIRAADGRNPENNQPAECSDVKIWVKHSLIKGTMLQYAVPPQFTAQKSINVRFVRQNAGYAYYCEPYAEKDGGVLKRCPVDKLASHEIERYSQVVLDGSSLGLDHVTPQDVFFYNGCLYIPTSNDNSMCGFYKLKENCADFSNADMLVIMIGDTLYNRDSRFLMENTDSAGFVLKNAGIKRSLYILRTQ
jgi:serine/threonine protein kinase